MIKFNWHSQNSLSHRHTHGNLLPIGPETTKNMFDCMTSSKIFDIRVGKSTCALLHHQVFYGQHIIAKVVFTVLFLSRWDFKPWKPGTWEGCDSTRTPRCTTNISGLWCWLKDFHRISRWFFAAVTELDPKNWRSRSQPFKGSRFHHPKKVTKNWQVFCFFFRYLFTHFSEV